MFESHFDRLVNQELSALRNRIFAEHRLEVERLRKQVEILNAELEQRHAPERRTWQSESGTTDGIRRVNVRMARTAQHWFDPGSFKLKEVSEVDLKSDTTQEKMQTINSGSDFGQERRSCQDLRSSARGKDSISGPAISHQASCASLYSSAWGDEEPGATGHESSNPADFAVHEEWKFRASVDKLTRRRSNLVGGSSTAVIPKEGTPMQLTRSEQERQSTSACRRNCMLQPNSRKHLTWELIVLTLICYDVVVIPMELLEPEEDELQRVLQEFGNVQRVFWTLDIFKSFLTGILMQNGTVDMRPQAVARRYATTWLPLDIVCVVIDWLTLADIGFFRPISGLLRFLRFFRILKLVRLFKAPEFTKFVSENVRSDTVILLAKIIQTIVLLLGTAHLIACLWYWVGTLPGSESTWLEYNNVKGLKLRHRWLWAMHWALAQFTGEIAFDPQNIRERAFAVNILFFTFLCNVMFVGSITTCMTQLMILSGKKDNQLTTLRRYLSDKQVSNQLSVRMLRNAQHALREYSNNLTEKSVEVLSMISEPLMMELHFELHSPVLMVHRFFLCYHEVNLSGIMTVCHNSVSYVHFTRDDRVFSEFEAPGKPRMFFCTHGKLRYEHEVSVVSRDMVKDQWACEAVLWTKWIHCGNLQAVHESTFHCIEADKFRRILGPTPFMHIRQYAVGFVHHLNSMDRAHLSDFHNEHIDDCVQEVFPWVVPSSKEHHAGAHIWFRPSLNRGETTFSFFNAPALFHGKKISIGSKDKAAAPAWSLEERQETINSDISNYALNGPRHSQETVNEVDLYTFYNSMEWAEEETC